MHYEIEHDNQAVVVMECDGLRVEHLSVIEAYDAGIKLSGRKRRSKR